jgi:hypothetical protein
VLGAPLSAQIETQIGANLWFNIAGIASALCSLRSSGAGLFSEIAIMASATTQLAADCAATPGQRSNNLANVLFSFKKAMNLVWFFLAEMLVQLVTWTCCFEWP